MKPMMHISSKQKLILIISGGIIMCFMVYFVAIKKTVDLAKKCMWIEAQLEKTNGARKRIEGIDNNLNETDHFFIHPDQSTNSVEYLLNIMSNYCHDKNIAINEFSQTFTFQADNYIVETNYVELNGVFVDLIKLLFYIEKKKKVGKITSVKFFTEKDYKNKQVHLYMLIYIQRLKHEF